MQDITRELNCLSFMLSQLLLPGSESKYVTASNAILRLMAKDFDLSPLADKIIKLLSLPFPSFKRIVCTYLIRYADNISNLNVHATNSFLKDFEDPNPFVRRLVIKTVCNIPCLHKLAFHLLPLAFCDNSSYVRSTAASSCTFLINENNLESKQNIIDKLYDMIRDPDPTVVSSSLAVLDIILYSEGGVVINARLARYLISRLDEFHEWHFATVCRVLKKHIPKSRDDLLIILNALDENLSDSNPLIFTIASDLALFYVKECFSLNWDEQISFKEKFSSDIIEQISFQIKFLFGNSNDELLCEVLNILQKYKTDYGKHLSFFYKLLFCRYSDPIFIKVKKLKLIIELGSSTNCNEVAEELLIYSCNCVKEVALQSIKSFIIFSCRNPISSNFIESFVKLIDIQYNNLNEEVLIALCSSRLDKRNDFQKIFLPTISNISSNFFSADGKIALLKLIANHGNYILRSPYMIEELLNDCNNVENENIMIMIIIASVKLFFVRPAEMQFLLGYVLQCAECSDSLLLRKQAMVYHHLLINTSTNNEILHPTP